MNDSIFQRGELFFPNCPTGTNIIIYKHHRLFGISCFMNSDEIGLILETWRWTSSFEDKVEWRYKVIVHGKIGWISEKKLKKLIV